MPHEDNIVTGLGLDFRHNAIDVSRFCLWSFVSLALTCKETAFNVNCLMPLLLRKDSRNSKHVTVRRIPFVVLYSVPYVLMFF